MALAFVSVEREMTQLDIFEIFAVLFINVKLQLTI